MKKAKQETIKELKYVGILLVTLLLGYGGIVIYKNYSDKVKSSRIAIEQRQAESVEKERIALEMKKEQELKWISEKPERDRLEKEKHALELKEKILRDEQKMIADTEAARLKALEPTDDEKFMIQKYNDYISMIDELVAGKYGVMTHAEEDRFKHIISLTKTAIEDLKNHKFPAESVRRACLNMERNWKFPQRPETLNFDKTLRAEYNKDIIKSTRLLEGE